MWTNPGLFCVSSSFSRYNSNLNWEKESLHILLWIRTRGRRMVDDGWSTKLWLILIECSIDRKRRPSIEAIHSQCDQIGPFLRGLRDNFSCKSIPNIPQLLGLFKKHHAIRKKTAFATFWQVMEVFGHFSSTFGRTVHYLQFYR